MRNSNLWRIAVSILMIAGCSQVNPTAQSSRSLNEAATSQTDKIALAASVEDRWLSGWPCLAPCYEGLTPGKTTFAEAQNVLKQNPNIVASTIQPYTAFVGLRSIGLTWQWKGSGSSVEVAFDDKFQSSVVVSIHPLFDDMPLLGTVTAKYGAPTHIWADVSQGPEPGSPRLNNVTFLYLDRGLVLTTKSLVAPDKTIISPNTPIDMVVFFVPGLPGLKRSMGKGLEDTLPFIVWQGYKDFSFYCTLSNPEEANLC